MKSKFLKFFTSVIVAMTFIFSTMAVPANAAYISGAQTGNVYFWNYSTGQSYSRILPCGTYVGTSGYCANGRAAVYYGGRTGYITAKFLHYYISGAQTGRVYFWTGSSGSGYYSILPCGTTVTSAGYSANGRTKVYYNGRTGWLTSKFLT